jgi:hypothetical protein
MRWNYYVVVTMHFDLLIQEEEGGAKNLWGWKSVLIPTSNVKDAVGAL